MLLQAQVTGMTIQEENGVMGEADTQTEVEAVERTGETLLRAHATPSKVTNALAMALEGLQCGQCAWLSH